ncbi:MAG: helix-turn-helix domain-containing protein [Candidatus Thiodiazotropha sp. (ex Dulcina madagascariensis)]|nr:helix-turn-helix domain-containing protein [Candidatus Thiodiazotropha sp. (ex Dulcina madagascariensis)]
MPLQALKRLGANLRTARLRRNLTIKEIADKIGTGPRAVMDAEKGRPSTGIVVYTALLWAYDLTPSMPISLDRRDLAMICGDWGRYAHVGNLVSQSVGRSYQSQQFSSPTQD